jgi:hypothetical protein
MLLTCIHYGDRDKASRGLSPALSYRSFGMSDLDRLHGVLVRSCDAFRIQPATQLYRTEAVRSLDVLIGWSRFWSRFGHVFGHGYQSASISVNHYAKPSIACSHWVAVVVNRARSRFIVIILGRSAKLRCGGSTPPGASKHITRHFTHPPRACQDEPLFPWPRRASVAARSRLSGV